MFPFTNIVLNWHPVAVKKSGKGALKVGDGLWQ